MIFNLENYLSAEAVDTAKVKNNRHAVVKSGKLVATCISMMSFSLSSLIVLNFLIWSEKHSFNLSSCEPNPRERSESLPRYFYL